MSMSDITIYRDLAVVGGFVQVPPNAESDKSRVTLAEAQAVLGDAGQTVRLSGVSGRPGGRQVLYRLPGLHPGQSYGPVNDPVRRLQSF